MSKLEIYRTHASIQLPAFATSQSACFDLAFNSAGKGTYKLYNKNNAPIERSFSDGRIHIMPGERVLVPTGLIMDIPEGFSVRVHARSGTSLKQGLVLVNAEGVIDSDYIDEVFVLITNISDNGLWITSGDRIAQAEMVKQEQYKIIDRPSKPYPKTNRIGGMGSTGVITLKTTDTVLIKTPDTIEIPEKRGRGRPKKVDISA